MGNKQRIFPTQKNTMNMKPMATTTSNLPQLNSSSVRESNATINIRAARSQPWRIHPLLQVIGLGFSRFSLTD
jgi:hypothetical protein